MSAATWMLFSKIVLISTGAISIAMAIKLSVPSLMSFAFYKVPMLWSTLSVWLKPPYIYFIVNGIIITIVASSRYSHKVENPEYFTQTQSPSVPAKTTPPANVVAATIPVQSMPEINVVETPPDLAYEAEDEREANIVELKPVIVNGIIETIENEAYDHVPDDDDDLVISNCTWSHPEADEADEGHHHLVISKSACSSPQKITSPAAQLDCFRLPVEKKPMLPSRFGQRKPIKVVPTATGGRAVRNRMARQKNHETLESTWKKIMESRERELKKSDTFGNHGRQVDTNAIDEDDDDYDDDVDDLLPRRVLKSATFRDRTNYDGIAADDAPSGRDVPALDWSSNMGKINRELSLSQDELNRRVEAFIKKFNDDMRLQRQRSIDQYMEMINRGAS